MDKQAKIFVAGHRGLVGSAVVRNLQQKGFSNLVLRTRTELDLTNQAQTRAFFEMEQAEYCIMAAAKVGGILYNRAYQADFLYDNIMIAANVTKAAVDFGTKKMLFLGSSCIYPKMAEQPISEEALLSGPLEPTNEGYALAKIAGLKLCEKYQEQYQKNFVSLMPTNLYGPGDNFHPDHSHVIPGMMRRFHQAKLDNAEHVIVWGTGTPKREFMHVDDLAEAIYVVMEKYNEPSTLNAGTGEDCSIKELAETMQAVVGYKGQIKFDTSKPDGTPRKVLNVDKIKALGWSPKRSLKEGLAETYAWALENKLL